MAIVAGFVWNGALMEVFPQVGTTASHALAYAAVTTAVGAAVEVVLRTRKPGGANAGGFVQLEMQQAA